MQPITNCVAVIIGAGGGIGQAIAARLAEAGARLALIDLECAPVAALAAGLPAESSLICSADITDRSQVDAAAQQVQERFGGADILVSAAGINTRARSLDTMAPEQWERVIAVDLTGVFHCTQAFLPLLVRRGGGSIVTISSAAAVLPTPGAGAHYSAAKRALLSLNESINLEQAGHGVRACVVCPGEVNTPLVDQRPNPPSPERRAAVLQPADIAEAVHFIVTRPPHVTISDLVIWPSAQLSGKYVI